MVFLDLHNVYVNCRNNGTDPIAFLAQVNLDRVIELHVAGGMEFEDSILTRTPGHLRNLSRGYLSGSSHNVPTSAGSFSELFGSW